MLFAVAVTAVAGLWLAHGGEAGRALRAFARVRWGLPGIGLVRMAVLLLCGTAWRAVVRRLSRVPLHVFQWMRLTREGLNVLSPVGAVGGDLVGMRLITFWSLPAGVAVASVAVDLLLQAGAQAAFTLIGVALLVKISGATALGVSMLAGIAAMVAGLVGFQLVQRRGIKPIGHLLKRLAAHERVAGEERIPAAVLSGGMLAELEAAMAAIWRDRAGLATGTALHFSAWLVGILEVWIALLCMGQKRGWEVAFILESLSQGARSMAFPIPAGIGVQEGGLIAVGRLLGIHPGVALAVSMVKRVADLAVGIPALMTWVTLEARHTGRRLPEPGGGRDP